MQGRSDVIVAGLGAMGSACAYQLAKGGARVLGFDRFAPPHALGSSHGETRIIREAYYEHPDYVPLVQRAFELWRELELAAGQSLLRETGGVMIGAPDGELVAGARASAQRHGLRHEQLSAAELRRRIPALQPTDDMVAIWEPRAGILAPEVCVAAQLAQAVQYGALLRSDEPVLRWSADGAGVRVETKRGAHLAEQLVICAGPWARALLPDWPLPLRVERQVLHWFDPRANAARFAPELCPIYLWEPGPGAFFYGFPDLGRGIKVALHHAGTAADPEAVDRVVRDAEVEDMRGLLRRFLPDADGRHRTSTVCLYTNTPDGHFLIGRHPEHAQVWLVSACSGHGFKFASVIGEAVAELVRDGRTRFALELFLPR